MSNPRRSWRLGEILVQKGWLTWQQLEAALELQEQTKKRMDSVLLEGGFLSKKETQSLCLGEILVKNGWLSWRHLEEGLDIQHQTGRILGEILVEKKFISKENLFHALAQQFNKPFVKPQEYAIPAEVIQAVPKYLVLEHKMMPLLKQKDVLLVAISSPQDVRTEAELRKKIPDCEIRSVIATPEDIQKAIERYYP